MNVFRRVRSLASGLLRYGPLRSLRSGALVAFSSEIGFSGLFVPPQRVP
jgi:hypothetical protein